MRALSSRSLLAVLILAPAAAADDWPQWMGPEPRRRLERDRDPGEVPRGRPEEALVRPRSAAGTPARPWPAARCTSPTGSSGKGSTGPDQPVRHQDHHPPGPSGCSAWTRRPARNSGSTSTTASTRSATAPARAARRRSAAGRSTPSGRWATCLPGRRRRERRSGRRTSRPTTSPRPRCGASAGHPLVYENLVICLVGGPKATLVVAFDKDTGKEVWKALSPATAGEPGYAPPTCSSVKGPSSSSSSARRRSAGLDPKSGQGAVVGQDQARASTICRSWPRGSPATAVRGERRGDGRGRAEAGRRRRPNGSGRATARPRRASTR